MKIHIICFQSIFFKLNWKFVYFNKSHPPTLKKCIFAWPSIWIFDDIPWSPTRGFLMLYIYPCWKPYGPPTWGPSATLLWALSHVPQPRPPTNIRSKSYWYQINCLVKSWKVTKKYGHKKKYGLSIKSGLVKGDGWKKSQKWRFSVVFGRFWAFFGGLTPN